jgi:hypothetical protein
MELDNALRKIVYRDGEHWLPLPAWGRFLTGLGVSAVDVSHTQRSRIIAVSVPTRSYASAFLGVGVILGSIGRDSAPGRHVECAEFLRSLPIGTPIWLRRHNKRLKAIYEGHVTYEGVPRFGIRVDNATTQYMRTEDCEGIELREAEDSALPGHQNGLPIDKGERFLSHILSEQDASSLVNHTRDDCVFVASVAGLHAELCGAFLGVHTRRGAIAAGCFQDIIRVRRFSRRGEGCRSDAFAVGHQPQRVARGPVQGKAVIFDGALGYLRWRDHWVASSRIVVLDRTDRNWPDAVEVLNRDYVERRCSDRLALEIPEVPGTIEIMAYEVPR